MVARLTVSIGLLLGQRCEARLLVPLMWSFRCKFSVDPTLFGRKVKYNFANYPPIWLNYVNGMKFFVCCVRG